CPCARLAEPTVRQRDVVAEPVGLVVGRGIRVVETRTVPRASAVAIARVRSTVTRRGVQLAIGMPGGVALARAPGIAELTVVASSIPSVVASSISIRPSILERQRQPFFIPAGELALVDLARFRLPGAV